MEINIQQQILDELKKISYNLATDNTEDETFAKKLFDDLYEIKGEIRSTKSILIRVEDFIKNKSK